MLLSRILEEKLGSLYRAGGRLVGGVYLGKGQEAFSAALGVQLSKGKDVLGTFIRDQAGRIAWGEPILDCLRTYFGSVLGPMRGRDGNVHRGRPKEGLPAMISHIGSMVGVVSGMLFARRLQGRLGDAIGVVTVGEGGTSTGAFHEGVNLAAVEKLPLVIAITNNQFAYSTPNNRQFACEDLTVRAAGYGIDGWSVDATDLVESLVLFRHVVRRAREGHGPQMVVGSMLRLTGHGEHDDASYVPDAVRKSKLGRDCMVIAEQKLLSEGWANAGEVEAWRAECRQTVDRAVTQVSKEPGPDPFKESWRALSTEDLAEGMWLA
jgi:pyruvate dehydrogenase E1 component alpha subunit/2-oxoisovalerate dehydrogenase E1 component alpha subunit